MNTTRKYGRPHGTSPLKRIANLINFQQQVKNNFQKTYEEIRDVAKQLEKIENVNQTLRDQNYELNSANETQNTTIQAFQQKILVRENQLKKRPLTPFTAQRSPKFPNPEKFGGARDELEPFKFNFRAKLQANGDWYPDEDEKLNYAFSRLKNFTQGQIFFKMDPTNVFKMHTVEKLLQYLNVSFGDQNKKQTVQNKIHVLKQKKRFFHEYLAEFQKYINDTGYDVANQKYCFFVGMQWKLNMLLIQHDTDRLTFDEMVKLSIALASRVQLANQNRFKNYNSVFSSNNIYVPPTLSTTSQSLAQHQVTITYINPAQPQFDQNDPMDFSATNRGFKKPLTAEQRKYRFENNLCLYCGKSDHRVLDHKLIRFTQRINFVSETFTPTHHRPNSQLKAHQHPTKEKRNPCIQSLARTITSFYFCINFNISEFGGSFK